jgi:hypothetical protein
VIKERIAQLFAEDVCRAVKFLEENEFQVVWPAWLKDHIGGDPAPINPDHLKADAICDAIRLLDANGYFVRRKDNNRS